MNSTPSATPASARARKRAWRWVRRLAVLTLLLGVGALLLLARLGFSPGEALQVARGSQPIEVIRYAEYRLLGHPTLEAVLLPALHAVRRRIEREPPDALTDLGKGQQAAELTPQLFDAAGIPQAASPADPTTSPLPASRVLRTVEELADAVSSAGPGTVLELAAGNYTIASTLVTGHPGTVDRPITLRARRPGTVLLSVTTEQGIVVNQPYWVFENLSWRGTCVSEDDCEHAFHVVGAARGTVIRNNRIEDFNAHIKINGEQTLWPDAGLLQFNSLRNSAPRQVDRPVSPIDLVGASGWQIIDNVVERFVKLGGDGISYGVFMKGGGTNGRIERNVVICTPQDISQPGLRIGISFGDGGTGAAYCRSPGCRTEHSEGVVASNVVAHCNDAGIDVHKSQGILVAHNTLINTRGILVRDEPSDAEVVGNLLDGVIRERRGGRLHEADNRIESSLGSLLVAPDALDLHWRDLPPTLPRLLKVPRDFCGRERPLVNPPGATLAARCGTPRP